MATIKYFADVNGDTTELRDPHGLPNADFVARFPGVAGKRYDSFSMLVGFPIDGSRELYPVTRRIEYKSFPSRHVCDARCMYARGRTMNCECSCGGKNHGKGGLTRHG
jgi:hypothetical protein